MVWCVVWCWCGVWCMLWYAIVDSVNFEEAMLKGDGGKNPKIQIICLSDPHFINVVFAIKL